MTKPAFDFLGEPPPLDLSGSLDVDEATRIFLDELCSGFGSILSVQDGLEHALRRTYEVVVALELREQRAMRAPHLSDIVPIRNAAQHSLLSFDIEHAEHGTGQNLLLCIVRLATLIFSDMVVCPLPATQRVKPRNAHLLRSTLEEAHEHRAMEANAELYLWASMMGSIGALDSPDQSWYVCLQRRLVTACGVADWTAMESVCSKFLWWPRVCDKPGLQVWDLMCHGHFASHWVSGLS